MLEVSTTSKFEPVTWPSVCSWSFDQPRARRAADVPVGAVVGDDHPVALQRVEHDPRLARERPDVEARLQADAQAHRRQVRVGERARVVPGGVEVGAARPLDGEAERVVDHAALRPRRSARGRGRSAGRPRPPRSSPRAGRGSSAGSRSRRPTRASGRRASRARRARRAGRRRGRAAARGGRCRPRCGRASGSGSRPGRSRPRTRSPPSRAASCA